MNANNSYIKVYIGFVTLEHITMKIGPDIRNSTTIPIFYY